MWEGVGLATQTERVKDSHLLESLFTYRSNKQNSKRLHLTLMPNFDVSTIYSNHFYVHLILFYSKTLHIKRPTSFEIHCVSAI